MSSSGNYLVPTADRPYVSVEGLSGVGFKPMNTIDQLGIWSAVIRVEAGQTLPARRNTALCEFLVIEGSGRYADGRNFVAGDYLREGVGDYGLIEAQDDLVLFATHHGDCTYVKLDESIGFVARVESITEMEQR